MQSFKTVQRTKTVQRIKRKYNKCNPTNKIPKQRNANFKKNRNANTEKSNHRSQELLRVGPYSSVHLWCYNLASWGRRMISSKPAWTPSGNVYMCYCSVLWYDNITNPKPKINSASRFQGLGIHNDRSRWQQAASLGGGNSQLRAQYSWFKMWALSCSSLHYHGL